METTEKPLSSNLQALVKTVRRQRRINLADSRIQGDEWDVYGSGIGDYERQFLSVLGGKSLVDFVKERQAPVTAIDLMGSSEALGDLFKKALNNSAFGIAVSLKDKRGIEQIERDRNLNIHQVAGDLMMASTWRKIEKIMAGRKADLIMERAVLGLSSLPYDDNFYRLILSRIWDMLNNDEGMFIGQTHPLRFSSKNLVWIEYAKQNNIDILSPPPHTLIKIVKHSDSPQDLRPLFKEFLGSSLE